MSNESAEAIPAVDDQPRVTIVGAIKKVLADSGPLTVDDVYDRILQRGLYVFGAADPKAVVRGMLRKHTIGLDFPSASPIKYFRLVGEDKYALETAVGVRPVPAKAGEKEGRIPEEVIDDAHKEHLAVLRDTLKEKILANPPVFFERLVIELLIKMGYGGSDPERGVHTGRPGDGGIDGVIKEDKLGLEKIYVQAKRYGPNRKIAEEEVRSFAGAMNKVRKGVFITTGKFSGGTRKFVEGHEKAISLIDGDMLCQLMIRHGVGVSDVATYRVLRIDNDYFSVDG